jgi:hypothetical protein
MAGSTPPMNLPFIKTAPTNHAPDSPGLRIEEDEDTIGNMILRET